MESENRSCIEELEREGWVKQFTASEPRLSEAVELYRQAGFEVHLEPLPKDLDCDACEGAGDRNEPEECRACFQGFEDQYKIIFTRPKKGSRPSEDWP